MAIIPGEQNENLAFIAPQQKSQKQSVYSLILALVLLAGIVYFSFFYQGADLGLTGALVVDPKQQQVDDIVSGLKSTRIDTEFFQNKDFLQLNVSGQLPVTVGQQGRENPFAPF